VKNDAPAQTDQQTRVVFCESLNDDDRRGRSLEGKGLAAALCVEIYFRRRTIGAAM
jgi:hypothetical protein